MSARLKAFAGHIWPAGRVLCMSALKHWRTPQISWQAKRLVKTDGQS